MHLNQTDTAQTLSQKQTHVLRTPEGVTLTLTLTCNPFSYHCKWSEIPKNPKRRERVFRHYVAWRDQIFEAVAQATRTCMVVATPGLEHMGIPAAAVFGEEFSKKHKSPECAQF